MANEAILAGFGIVFAIILIIIAIVVLAILAFVFWILMIVDCAKRNFKSETEKIVWILILIFLQLLGAIIYYFVVKVEDKKNKK